MEQEEDKDDDDSYLSIPSNIDSYDDSDVEMVDEDAAGEEQTEAKGKSQQTSSMPCNHQVPPSSRFAGESKKVR